MNTGEITFEQVLALAQRLQPIDQARLIARLIPVMEKFLDHVDTSTSPRMPLRGLLADLGPAPSAEDIVEVQQEMWASFAQDEDS
jgi:hypothetical protein